MQEKEEIKSSLSLKGVLRLSYWSWRLVVHMQKFPVAKAFMWCFSWWFQGR